MPVFITLQGNFRYQDIPIHPAAQHKTWISKILSKHVINKFKQKFKGSYNSLNADTYEIVDDEYLKWGKYSDGWMEYKYTYWNIKISGKHLTLTMKDNPERVMELTKE